MKSLTQTKILVLDKQVSAGLSSFKMSDVEAAVTFRAEINWAVKLRSENYKAAKM